MDDDQLLLEDLEFNVNPELEGFLSGPSIGTVCLEMPPTCIGNADEVPSGTISGEAEKSKTEGGAAGGGGIGAAANAGVAALTGLVMGAMANKAAAGMLGGVVEKVTPAVALSSVQTAGKMLRKAQPWKDFCWPLSVPSASEGCSRITANVYNFQTNYAILFVAQLVLAILWQPSALISLIITVVVWVFFLKKNEDPEWAPELGGVALGPMQRWLLLAAATAVILLFVAGGTIINTSFMFLLFSFCHGVFHDPSALGVPGGGDGPPVPL